MKLRIKRLLAATLSLMLLQRPTLSSADDYTGDTEYSPLSGSSTYSATHKQTDRMAVRLRQLTEITFPLSITWSDQLQHHKISYGTDTISRGSIITIAPTKSNGVTIHTIRDQGNSTFWAYNSFFWFSESAYQSSPHTTNSTDAEHLKLSWTQLPLPCELLYSTRYSGQTIQNLDTYRLSQLTPHYTLQLANDTLEELAAVSNINSYYHHDITFKLTSSSDITALIIHFPPSESENQRLLYVPPTIIPLKIPNEVIHVPDGETTYDIGNNIKFCVLLAEDQKNTTTYIQLPWPTGPVFELRALDDELHRPIEASSVCELGTGSYDATTDAATYTGSLSLAEEHIVQLLAGQKDSDGEYINRVYYYRFEADTQLATLSYVYDPKAETLEIVLDFGKFAQLPIYRAGKEIGGTQPETLINKIKVSVVFTDDEETFLPESPSTYDGNIMTLSYTSLPNLDGQTLRVILNTSSRNILSDHTLEFTIYVPPQYPPQIAVNYDVDNARLIAAISHLFRISPSLNIQQRFAYGAPVDITDKVEIVPSEIDQTNELPAGKQLTCTFAPDQSCITVIGFAYQVPSTTAKSATETRYYYFLGSNAHYAPLLASYDDSDGQLACQLNLAALRNLPAISFEGGDTTTLSGTYNHSFRILGDETHVEQPLPLIFPSFNSADSHRLTLSVLEDCAGRVLRTFFPMDGDTVPGLPAIDTTIQSALKICPWCNEIIEPTWQHSSIPVLQSWIVRHKFCRDKMTLVVIPMHHCCEIAFGATAFESSRGKNRIIAETSTPFTQRNAADIEKPLARYHLGPNVKIQYSARLRSAHWRGPDSTFLFT